MQQDSLARTMVLLFSAEGNEMQFVASGVVRVKDDLIRSSATRNK